MRALRLLTLGLLALALAGCQALSGGDGGGDGPGGTSRLTGILDSGALRVGLSADLPPLNMKNREGDVVGFEVDIVEALAGAMGIEMEIVEMPFQGLLPAVERGDLDVAISGITITPERNARVAFAGPYFISGMSVLARSADIAEVREPDELNRSDRRYVALAESTSAQFISDFLPEATLLTVTDYEEAVAAVLSGNADAMLADHLACSVGMWRNPDRGLVMRSSPFSIEPLGIALPAEAPLLLNLVQNYLNTLKSTGLLARYKAKWLADGSWMSQLP